MNEEITMREQHLLSPCADSVELCYGCRESVKRAPNGRYFITMGHPGFNTLRNNADGYLTIQRARAIVAHYASKARE